MLLTSELLLLLEPPPGLRCYAFMLSPSHCPASPAQHAWRHALAALSPDADQPLPDSGAAEAALLAALPSGRAPARHNEPRALSEDGGIEEGSRV